MTTPTDLAPAKRSVVRATLESLVATPTWNLLAQHRHLSRAYHLLRGAGMGAHDARAVRRRMKASAWTLRKRSPVEPRDYDLAVDLALTR